MNPRSAIVRTRSHRRYRVTRNPKGVIYLPNIWLGKKIKVVDRKHWAWLVKRVHKLECVISRVRRIAK